MILTWFYSIQALMSPIEDHLFATRRPLLELIYGKCKILEASCHGQSCIQKSDFHRMLLLGLWFPRSRVFVHANEDNLIQLKPMS